MVDCARPVFTFGIIADIQYADIDDGLNFLRTHRRYYRNSLQLLRKANQSWNEENLKPRFILQLGDIIDGYNKNNDASDRALETVVKEFDKSLMEVHHVWGNHEFYNFSRKTLFASPVNSGGKAEIGSQLIGDEIYAYHFSPAPKFRFVVVDAYDQSIIGRDPSSEKYIKSLKLLKEHNSNPDLNHPPGASKIWPRFTCIMRTFRAEIFF